jgi:hypothetical protein
MSWLPDTGLPSCPPTHPVHHLYLTKVVRQVVLRRLARSKVALSVWLQVGWLDRVLAFLRPNRVRAGVWPTRAQAWRPTRVQALWYPTHVQAWG